MPKNGNHAGQQSKEPQHGPKQILRGSKPSPQVPQGVPPCPTGTYCALMVLLFRPPWDTALTTSTRTKQQCKGP